MEREPDIQHGECPNCGFEMDLNPSERENVAKDLGSAALGNRITEHRSGLLVRPEEVNDHCLITGLADLVVHNEKVENDHSYGPVVAPGSDKNHELLIRLKRIASRKSNK